MRKEFRVIQVHSLLFSLQLRRIILRRNSSRVFATKYGNATLIRVQFTCREILSNKIARVVFEYTFVIHIHRFNRYFSKMHCYRVRFPDFRDCVRGFKLEHRLTPRYSYITCYAVIERNYFGIINDRRKNLHLI